MPVELDHELIDKVAFAVRKGEWPKQALQRQGVSPSRALAWWTSGVEASARTEREGLEGVDFTDLQWLCLELVGRCWVAEAIHENQLIVDWHASLKAGKAGLWQGYKNLLEIRYPDRWRKREMEKGVAGQVSPEEEFRRMAEAEKAK